ncbi:MAG TPA: sugar ABC transporter permease [Thermoanaerobaculia bacterium]|nr:sugar ABC transporter permease [Thermoanaerobaculia bacterium]
MVTLSGIRLEASTDPEDTGGDLSRAAPRRLAREEKPLFDLAQRLRTAVAENREAVAAGENARADEIAAERTRDGLLTLSAPVELDGEVTGMAQIETRPVLAAGAAGAAGAGWPWWPTLLAILAPVVLFFLLSLVLGERRALLAAAAAVLLVGTLIAYGRWGLAQMERERRATGETLAAKIAEEAGKAEVLLGELGVPSGEPLDGSLWDADFQRQPRGLVTAGGTLDEGKLGEAVGADSRRLTRSVTVLALAALLLLTFVGFGYAARTRAALRENYQAYLYVLPAMLGMLLLVFFPFFYGIALAFTNANVYNTNQSIFETWVGLGNFVDILSDVQVVKNTESGRVVDYTNFYWTLGFTIVWTISNVVLGVTLGLILALILNTKGLALRPMYRVLLILPWAVPTYITALVWQGMFHKQFGVVNQILQIFGADAVAWFDRPLTSFLAVLTTNGWLSFPFMMVVSLGALQSIPADLYEAARVDGATRWQQFKAITLPSLRPALVPAVILSVIWTFNQFNVIYLVSAGQPAGATEILITQAYKLAFEQYRYGYAAAYSTVIFLILLVYGTWQNRVTQATESIG